MAKCNREFLIPYLESLCALYFFDNKISKKCEQLNQQIRKLENAKNAIVSPEYPNPLPIVTGKRVLKTLLCALSIYLGVKWIPNAWNVGRLGGLTTFLIFAVIVIYLFITSIGEMYSTREQNNAQVRLFDSQLSRNEDRIKTYQDNHKKAIAIKATLQQYIHERQKVAETIQQVYNANVIPRQYRDIYAVVYLYDYFSTSLADDLDTVLSLYVLEQIKAKIDIVIAQQSELILNSRLMLAKQQKTIEEQRAYAVRMEEKVRKLTNIEEERNQYYKMIESNTAATAYFAESVDKYIRDL